MFDHIFGVFLVNMSMACTVLAFGLHDYGYSDSMGVFTKLSVGCVEDSSLSPRTLLTLPPPSVTPASTTQANPATTYWAEGMTTITTNGAQSTTTTWYGVQYTQDFVQPTVGPSASAGSVGLGSSKGSSVAEGVAAEGRGGGFRGGAGRRTAGEQTLWWGFGVAWAVAGTVLW